MFDIFDDILALTEVEFMGKKYLRLKTIKHQDGIETLLAVENNSELPATVQLIQVKSPTKERKK